MTSPVCRCPSSEGIDESRLYPKDEAVPVKRVKTKSVGSTPKRSQVSESTGAHHQEGDRKRPN